MSARRRQLPAYGGQAVVEGVMMRGRQVMAIAVRAPDGQIRTRVEPLGRLYRSPLARIPFVRGIIGLWDAIVLGYKALHWSVQVQAEGEGETLDERGMLWSSVLAFVVGIGLFMLLPAAAGQASEQGLGLSPWWGNLVEGLVRLALVVGYIAAIGLIPEVQRLYGYHGAEHKTIHAFEHGAALTVEGVRPFPEEHPRCGTAFLLILVLVSVVLFSLLGPMGMFARLASRILLLPVLAGLAYEYLRFTAAHMDHPLVRVLVQPNLWLQKLTTRPPSD
ncbi:MAG: DUF1385 domain-containing protein, partial [Chloroflexi bacterium]|nr:DUF1385 domain-containing protein [Chloroflexota bacterium]